MNYLRAILLLAVTPMWGQHVITINWADKTMANAPAKVDQPLPVKLRVTNVNDFLYSYEAKIKYEPKVAEIFSKEDLGGLMSVTSKRADCRPVDALTKEVATLAEKFILPEPKKGDKFISRPLKDSVNDWDEIAPKYVKLEKTDSTSQSCASFETYTAKLQPRLQELAKIARGTHEFSIDDVLPGDGKYTVYVNEFYGEGSQRAVTEGGAYTATFYANTSRFFLSIGYLGSQVPSRSYDTVVVGQETKTTTNAAGVTSTATSEVKSLRIQGTGAWRPTAALLLNYKLPFDKLMGERVGMAISAGPVYRVASTQTGSTATNWGVFAGLSLYLWERLVLTPGVHLGEFSDTPLGFHSGGNFNPIIPAGITTVSGVSRSTARFGIGITFQAADFKKAAALATFAANPRPPAASSPAAADAPAVALAKPPSTPPPAAPEPVAPAPPAATEQAKEVASSALADAEATFTAEKVALEKAREAFRAADDQLSAATKALTLTSEAERAAAQKLVVKRKAELQTARRTRKEAETAAEVARQAKDKAQAAVNALK